MESEDPPEEIEDWYRRVIKMDRHWRQMKAEEKFYRRERKEAPKPVARPLFTPQQALQQSQPVQGPAKPFTPQWARPAIPQKNENAMDVDRGQRGPPTCFKCGKKGHIARNCWARVEQQARLMTREDWRRMEEEERQKKEQEGDTLNLKE